MTQLPNTATLRLPSTFDPVADSQAIHATMKNKGASAEDVLEILIPRTINQRTQIRSTYQHLFSKDIIVDITNKEGDFENLLFIMFNGPINFTAREMVRKFKADDIDDALVLMKNSQLIDFRKAYDTYKKADRKPKELEELISEHTKGLHTNLILSLLAGNRDEISQEKIQAFYQEHKKVDGIINVDLVCSDAKALHDAVEKKNVNEEVFVGILGKRDDYHIKCIYMAFKNAYNTTLVEYIEKHVSKPLRNTLNTIVMKAVDERLLLSAQLYNSMKGLGTNERNISRIIATRAETDLEVIKFIYEERVGKNLAETVNSETSGDLRSYLLGLLGVPMKDKKMDN